MSAANDRIRQALGFGLIEAERGDRKNRPTRRRDQTPEARPRDDITRALLDGVVLQVRK